MEKKDLDALVASTTTNVQYLTDVPGLVGYSVLPRERNLEPYLITCIIYVDRVLTSGTWLKDIRFRGPTYYFETGETNNLTALEKRMKKYVDEAVMDVVVASVNTARSPSMIKELVKGLEERGLNKGRIGIERAGTSSEQLRKLKKYLPNAKFVFADQSFDYARMIKTEHEQNIVAESSSIIDKGFRTIGECVKEGVTEGELCKTFKHAVVDYGYEGAGAPYSGAQVTFGRRTIMASSWTGSDGENKLKRGEVIRVGAHIDWKNHPCHHQRTMVLGEPNDPRVNSYWKGIIGAQNAGLAILKPGVKASKIYKVMIKEAKKHIPKYRRHHMGHALSLGGAYDTPNFMARDNTLIEEGMVFNIEPSLYLEFGFGGFSLEDTLVVTKNGYNLYTTTSRDIWRL